MRSIAIAFALAGCAAASTPPPTPGVAVVVHVVDGDTIDIVAGHHRDRVRLLGINTPEVVDPRKPIECYGPEASARTKLLLPAGTEVMLVRDSEPRDDYGRLLAYVYRRADGLFVNLDLVVHGYAVLLTHPPNTAHASELVRAAADAKRAHRGLWATCRTSPLPKQPLASRP